MLFRQVLSFPGVQVWIGIKAPFHHAVIFIHAIMQMGREFSCRTRRAVAGASHAANELAWFNYLAHFQSFCKAIQVGKIMIDVLHIPDADAPSSVFIPPFHFTDAVAG